MRDKVFEITSIVPVRGIPLRVKTVEAAATREAALTNHTHSIGVAHPHSRGTDGLCIGLQHRPDLEAWATEKVIEALERARVDSRKPLPIPDASVLFDPGLPTMLDLPLGCLACFTQRLWPNNTYHGPHTCKKTDHA